MKYENIDSKLLNFFQKITIGARKIGIRSTILVNAFLIIQLTAQASQIIILYLSDKSLVGMFLLAFPTWLVILYFRYMIKKSKNGIVPLDFIRAFITLFAVIETSNFIFRTILSLLFQHTVIWDETGYYRSEIAYLIAYIAFFCFIHLLSCQGETRRQVYHKMLVEKQ